MILGIDAGNIRTGGGLTHLSEIVKSFNPERNDFEKVVIWSSQSTLDYLPNFNWLDKRTHFLLNCSNLTFLLFQIFYLKKELRKLKVSILFVPGGIYLGDFKNFVSISQNLLPFEKNEIKRFDNCIRRLKFNLIRISQIYTFRRSTGIIFLTNYAKNVVTSFVDLEHKRIMIIPHGSNSEWSNIPKEQRKISSFTMGAPYRLLYVSAVLDYKHQWVISEAVLKLRLENYPLELILVGPHSNNSLRKLKNVISKDTFNCIKYLGTMKNEELIMEYQKADGFIFGSTCENQPIILIEAMSVGLPIVSSYYGPMKEVLEDNCFYFNPTDVQSTYNTIKLFLENPDERKEYAWNAFHKANNYSWKQCAESTYGFLFNLVE